MISAVEAVASPNPELTLGGLKLAGWMVRGLAVLRNLGPYAAIELILPGGSIIAVLLWLYRRSSKTAAQLPSTAGLNAGVAQPM